MITDTMNRLKTGTYFPEKYRGKRIILQGLLAWKTVAVHEEQDDEAEAELPEEPVILYSRAFL